MLNVSRYNQEFMKKYLPDVDKYIEEDDIGGLLSAWDQVIIEFGYKDVDPDNPRYELSRLGDEMDTIYLELYENA